MKEYIRNKFVSLFLSRRFYASVFAGLTIVFSEGLNLSPEVAEWIAGILMVWVVGDSLNKTVYETA